MLRFLLASLIAFISFLSLILLAGVYVLLTTPRPDQIKSCFVTEMYHVRVCPKEPSYTFIREVPTAVKMAIIVSEDSSFFDHSGFDWFELKESLKKDLKEGHFARGGSTITQQLAKNLYLNKEKSLFRKIREAIIVSQIEEKLTKEEILEKYLNVVEFGPEIYGIRQAAKYYFSKTPSELSVAEGAWLAILLPNPIKNSISFQKKTLSPFARREMTKVIRRLQSFKKISPEAADASIAELNHFFSPKAMSTDDVTQSLKETEKQNSDENNSSESIESEDEDTWL